MLRRGRSTLLAGSVRDCAIDLNFAASSSPSDNSIARRHAAMTFTPLPFRHKRSQKCVKKSARGEIIPMDGGDREFARQKRHDSIQLKCIAHYGLLCDVGRQRDDGTRKCNAHLLAILEAEGSASCCNGINVYTEPLAPRRPAVYLAECSYDRREARQLVEGELIRLGYPTFPNERLPAGNAEYVAAVESLLARSALSIHFIGESYGPVPDGPTGKSAGILQNELAVARCRSGGLKRLIWLPRGTHGAQALQQAFIEALHEDAQAQFGADLIAGDIEELRAAIHDTLMKIERPETERQTAGGANMKLIYLICDEKDRKLTVPVRKLCKKLGFEVALPAFAGDASQVRKINQQLLAGCDAVFLFYGAGDEAWKRTIDNELKKLAAYRGRKPMPAIYTYLAKPRTNAKEDLIDMEEPGLIDGLDGFAEAAIVKCIEALTLAGATT
jgi:hypothetical protein